MYHKHMDDMGDGNTWLPSFLGIHMVREYSLVARTRTHSHARAHTDTLTRTHTHARTHARTRRQSRTHTHTHTHPERHRHSHAHTHTRTHICTHTRTHSHARQGAAGGARRRVAAVLLRRDEDDAQLVLRDGRGHARPPAATYPHMHRTALRRFLRPCRLVSCGVRFLSSGANRQIGYWCADVSPVSGLRAYDRALRF
jgi:hypothetical protein